MIRRIWFKLYRILLTHRIHRMAVIFVFMVVSGIYLTKKAGKKISFWFSFQRCVYFFDRLYFISIRVCEIQLNFI